MRSSHRSNAHARTPRYRQACETPHVREGCFSLNLPDKVVEASQRLGSAADGRWLGRHVAPDPMGAAGGMRENPHLGRNNDLHQAEGCVRAASAALSPFPLARKCGITYFPNRRSEFITSALVAGPAWKIGMISVAPICS
jgi:hypothetical protein